MVQDTHSVHDWQMDSLRTRLEISIIVYRCAVCGCLQIKNGGPDAPSVYRPTHPGWNPFRTLPEEPPCQPQLVQPMRVVDVSPTTTCDRTSRDAHSAVSL